VKLALAIVSLYYVKPIPAATSLVVVLVVLRPKAENKFVVSSTLENTCQNNSVLFDTINPDTIYFSMVDPRLIVSAQPFHECFLIEEVMFIRVISIVNN